MEAPEWIYGRHAVQAVLAARPGDIQELWVQERAEGAAVDAIEAQARKLRIPVQRVTAAALRRHTRAAAHQGLAARARPRPAWSERDLSRLVHETSASLRLLVLDGITDPQNLGACLRVAEAAGVHAVMAPARRQAGLSGGVAKSAAGAAERVPLVRVPNLGRALEQLKQAGVWLYAAAAEAEAELWRTSFRSPWAIVIGGEGAGLRARTRALCDFSVCIPMQGRAESLNAATAAGILLFEAARQHAAQEAAA